MPAVLIAPPAAVAPVKPAITGLFRANDYPSLMASRGEEGPVAMAILAAPDGRVDNCTVFLSSRYKDLDDYTCDIIKKRAKFAPVTGEDGKPAYGLYNQIVTWSLDFPKSYRLQPDLELQINHAPPGVSLPLEFKVAYIYEPDGSIHGCRLAPEEAAQPKDLVDVACQSFAEGGKEIVRNSAGQPVEAWTVSTVRFTAG